MPLSLPPPLTCGLTLSFTSKRQEDEEWLLGIPYLLVTPANFEVP